MRLQLFEDAKATTVDDVRAAAESWQALIDNGVRSTSGTESTLIGAKDLFDVIIYPDGTTRDASAPAA